jgi:hypothetical protein
VKDVQFFSKRVALVGVLLFQSFLKNADLHLLLIDLLAEE